MQKYVFVALLLIGGLVVGGFAHPAHAEEVNWAGPLGKLNRGVINTATGWTEIFLQPARHGFSGLLTGPAYAVGRTVIGPLEIATFLFPTTTEGSYEPLIKPATPFETIEETERGISGNSELYQDDTFGSQFIRKSSESTE